MNKQYIFPPHDLADDDGLLAIGGDLSVSTLLSAYQQGIFPWPLSEELLTWFSPPQRAILFLEDLKVPRSLTKTLKQKKFTFTVDQQTALVIESCASVKNRFDSAGRPQPGTWITKDMIRAYKELALNGYVHSVETWDGAELVGGLYGVSFGKMFAGESMFYKTSNASKAALVHLTYLLQAKGVSWLDCQVMTPLFRSLGAKEIERSEFLELLREAISQSENLFS